MTLVEILTVAIGLGLAGLSKGTVGFGMPLVATPILAGVFGPRGAVVIMTIPMFVANLLVLWQGRDRLGTIGREYVPVLLAGVIGTAIGVNLLASIDQRVFAILIVAMVVLFLFGGDRLLGDNPNGRRARIIGPLVGLFGGGLQGTTSIASPLIGSYLHMRRLTPADYVLAISVIFQLNVMVQLVGYALLGLYSSDVVTVAFLGLIPTLLALWLGIRIRRRIDDSRFRQMITALIVVTTAVMLVRTFTG